MGRLCVTQLCVSGSHCRGPGHTATLQGQWFCGSMDLDLDFWGYLLPKELGSGWEKLPEEAWGQGQERVWALPHRACAPQQGCLGRKDTA